MDGDHGRDDTDASALASLERSHTRPRTASAGASAWWPDEGTALGRYHLRRVLGAGAMGEVWLAWDDQLAREVAIKVVQLRDASKAAAHADRLVREAKALARISHPNVVQIYDVGSHDPGDGHGAFVFVVMELVRGCNLGQWLAASPRRVADIVAAFVAAGRGLAGVHAAGLVHRDVKPTNIFVGDDGRVRIGDFGLARASMADDAVIHATAVDRLDDHPLDVTLAGSLTDTGTVVGTPMYMAPEQHAGKRIDARGDQYAFCVALYEALYRVRPFAGSLRQIALAKWTQHPTRATRVEVSSELHAVVWRGLAPVPEARWPDMDALIAALGRAERTAWPRRRAGLAAMATLGVVGLALWPARAPDCPSVTAAIWNTARRGELASSSALVDGHARALDDLDARLCRAQVDRDDPRRACVRQAVAELDETLTVIAEARDPATLGALLEGLPAPELCNDARAIAMPSPERLAAVGDALERLARARALLRGDRDAEALAIARDTLAAIAAGQLPAAPLAARARLVEGRALDGLDLEHDAIDALGQAHFAALADDDVQTAFAASRVLAMLHAEGGEVHEGRLWLRHAEAELARLEPPLDPRIELASVRATVEIFAGELEAARSTLERGLEACPIATCAQGPGLARNLAVVLVRMGEHARAIEQLRRVLDHEHTDARAPGTLQLRLDLVRELLAQHELDAATDQLAAVAEILERNPDVSYRLRVDADGQLAELRLQRADIGGAIDLLERNLATMELRIAADDPRLATHMNDLASAYLTAGRGAEAVALLERSRALTAANDPNGYEHAMVLVSLGYTRGELGDHDAALADLAQGRALVLALLSADSPLVAQIDVDIAHVLTLAGRCAEALPRWRDLLPLYADDEAARAEIAARIAECERADPPVTSGSGSRRHR